MALQFMKLSQEGFLNWRISDLNPRHAKRVSRVRNAGGISQGRSATARGMPKEIFSRKLSLGESSSPDPPVLGIIYRLTLRFSRSYKLSHSADSRHWLHIKRAIVANTKIIQSMSFVNLDRK